MKHHYKDKTLAELPWRDLANNELWSPRVMFLNCVQEISEKAQTAWVEPSGNKLVWKFRGRSVFSETFNLRLYPFDVQRLALRLISRRPRTELQFVADDDGGTNIDPANFMQDNEWSIVR
jgi:hypothetical protein